MTSSSKKAMTWATLAAAVASALVVAAIDGGWPDGLRGGTATAGGAAAGRQTPAPGTGAGRDSLNRGGLLQR